MKPRRNKRTRSKGASLIVTLLCLTVLTIIVVAFLQSMSIERKTAVAYSSITRAQLAAESAQNEAITRISALMTALPYHAIGYTNVPVNGVNQLFTILFGSQGSALTPKTYFLCSSLTTSTNQLDFTNVPNTLNASNSTPINRRTGDGSTNDPGWMGSPVTTAGALQYRECRAPWVYILQNPSKAHQPNPSSADFNPYVARYAWWVEDETSKLDLNAAGNNSGPSGSFLPAQSTNLVSTNTEYKDAQFTLPSQIDLGAVPIANGIPLSTNNTSTNNQLITFLKSTADLPRDGRVLAQAPGATSEQSTTSEQKARFYTTLDSVSNDMAGNGMRRANINAIVTENDSTPATIAADLDDIAYVISGTHIFKGIYGLNNTTDKAFFVENTEPGTMSDFGSRICPAGGGYPTQTQKETYLIKIAANIRDYITASANPTFVTWEKRVWAGAVPPMFSNINAFPHNLRYGNALMPKAIGQKPLPYFHKHAYAFRITSWNSSTRALSFTMDEHFSFYNPTTKDFIAPAGSFVRVYNRFGWSGGGVGTLVADDVEIDISGKTFPAGRTTVVTTSPASSWDMTSLGSSVIRGGVDAPMKNLTRNSATPEGVREFSNLMVADLRVSPINALARGTDGHDYQTMLVLGNSKGYFSGHGSVITTQAYRASIVAQNSSPSVPLVAVFSDAKTTTYLTTSSLCGNDGASRSGDPRSLNEALEFNSTYSSGIGASSSQKDQDRFYFGSTPLGTADNSFINPLGGVAPWPDPFNCSALQENKNWAYGVVRCEPMTSIGELGNIYDPHRKPPVVSDPPIYARGGGRTLKIGQPDDVIGGAAAARFNATWQNGAWHLTDIFDVVLEPDPSDSTKQVANRTDAEAPSTSRGKLNINSITRDGGVTLRAMLRRFAQLPSPYGDFNIQNRAWTETEMSTVINQLTSYISAKGPIMERGEISQIAFFSSGAVGGISMSTTMDRAREELIRRIIPMVTTRSSSFSVHSVAQSIQETSNGNIKVLAEATKGNVFQFQPIFDKNSPQPFRRVAKGYTATSEYEKL